VSSSDANRSHRALRIGLFLNGRPLEERVLRRRETVTVGPDARCTFIVPPQPSLPARLPLFEVSEQGYALVLHDAMRGRVTLAGEEHSVSDLRDESMPDRDGLCRISLDDAALGELRLGELKLLFQFIKSAPLPPRPVLPVTLRPSLTDVLLRDRRVLQLGLVSFVLHFGFVAYLRAMERPKTPDIEEIPDRFVRMLVPKLPPPKLPPPKKVEVSKPTEAKKDDAKKPPETKPGSKSPAPAKPNQPEDPTAAARAAAERQARMAEQLQNLGVLKMLTAKGPGGALADVLKNGGPDRDADQVFREVGGVGPATGDRSLGAARGGGSGQSQGIGGLVASGPSDGVGTGSKAEKKVRAVVQDAAPQDLDPGDLDPQAVIAKIRQYRGALVACYEAALKRNPTLAGKITLRFTIGKIGKVTKVDIEADTMHDDDVSQCIIDHAKNWRFPPPQSGSDGVQFSYPFIFQASK
jgi:hypothetical protein